MPAADRNGLLDKINGLGEQAASGTGIEIVEIQLRGGGRARLLRVYIDKSEGVTHGDCELISQRFGALLDAEDGLFEEGYTLEVSSPGVERQLSKPRDFERVIGQKIRVALREPIDGQQRWEGKLTGFADDALQVEVAPEHTLRIPRERVQKANLKFEW